MARVLTGTKTKTVAKKTTVKKAAPVKYKIGAVKPIKRYKAEPEVFVINGTAPSLKKLVPQVKVRVSRGKNYDVNKKVTNQNVAVEYFREYFTKYKVEGQEQFAVMYLSRSNSVLGIYVNTIGTMTSSQVDIKLVLAAGLQLAAEAMITCHNHPSGSTSPSEADRQLAKTLKTSAQQVGIELLDNIIVTKTGSGSF